MKKLTLLTVVLLQACFGFAQTGGEHIFSFLDLGYNARANALGTDFITVKDDDVNLAVINPSLLNSGMHHKLGFNHAFMAGGINYGMLSYAQSINESSTFSGHLRYLSYGEMIRRDETGLEQGTFSAGDFIFGGGYGKQLNEKIAIGANLNFIYSQLESFSSLGLSLDLAANYALGSNDRTLLTVLVRNAGLQIKSYTEKNREPLRADAQIGISHKLAHAPFRFSLVAHDLNRWDLSYNDPNATETIDPITNDTLQPESAGFGNKLARHFTFQVEVLLGKSLHIRTAFDVQRRQEMALETRPGLSGFSFGVGMYFKRFSLDYGLNVYSQAGYTNMFTLTTNFDKWKK